MNSLTKENMQSTNKNVSNFQKGTKFERLRRELESLGQEKSYQPSDFINDYHIDSLNKSSRLSTFSTLSNMSTSSSIKSEPMTYHSILSEPLNYSSDNNNTASYENTKSKYSTQRNAFLNSELDSSDSNSNGKRFKISDLKRSDKINIPDGKLRDIKGLTNNNNGDVNSLHYMHTAPGATYGKSFTLNRDINTLFSNSSSLLETDLDSATLSTGNIFPQTGFYGNQSAFSFEKTRSMIDIRNNSDVSYNEGITRAISSEDLKKTKPVEDSNFVKRLRSKAQSTQELRIADSLTKLNVPEWMKDFKSKDLKLPTSQPTERKSLLSLGESNTIRFKDIKRHDSILSKYKYDSLPLSRNNVKAAEPSREINQINLPSSLYRSKSQNLLYFNPKEDSKLKSAMENLSSSLKSLNVSRDNVNKVSESISHSKEEKPIKLEESKLIVNNFESPVRLIENKPIKTVKILESTNIVNKIQEPTVRFESKDIEITTDENSVKRVTSSKKNIEGEINFKNFEVIDNIVMQTRKESQIFLQKIIDSTLNPFLVIDDICTAFRINPTTLKLLLNVKRKTPNLNRDETFANMKLNEKSYIENALRKNENHKYVIFCDFKTCKNELFHTTKISRTTCSCYNCYTYYCSKKCRNMGFTQHFPACSFKRIREMLLKIKNSINEEQTNALSNYAIEAYKSFGRGLMTIAFESCRSADDFINKQPNRLMSQPYYLKLSDVLEIDPADFMNYNPNNEFVICLIISATLPMTNVELSYPTFKHCYSINYTIQPIPQVKNSNDTIQYRTLTNSSSIPIQQINTSNNTIQNRTLANNSSIPIQQINNSNDTIQYRTLANNSINPIQHSSPVTNSINTTPIKISKDTGIENNSTKVKFDDSVKISNEKSQYEIRKEFFNYVINFFETKNVNLNQSYSSIYKKLENFMLKGVQFEPLTVYIKDPLINSTVSCTIYPNKDVTLKPVRTATKSNKSTDSEPNLNGSRSLAETEI